MILFSCKDNVQLMSDALDRRLTLPRRLALSVHLLGCPMCSRFRRQLLFLHRAARRLEEQSLDGADNGSSALSEEARARIRNALESENA